MVGRLTVITGPMASGKTLELIRILSRREIKGANKILFKHNVDVRDGNNKSVSRIGIFSEAVMVKSSKDLRKKYTDFKTESNKRIVVGIEEAQFFDDNLFEEVRGILDEGVDVYLTCLNQDFRGDPFGFRDKKKLIPNILSIADDLKFLTAVCLVCGNDATKTQRLAEGKITRASEPLVLVGGNERYEPRCADCWIKPDE